MNKNELKQIARNLAEKYAKNELQKGYKPAGLHPYNDIDGNFLYMRIRLKHPKGDKWIRPFYLNRTTNKWVLGEPKSQSKKPLYRLSTLNNNQDSEVWITEGEQKVEALEKFGFVATTSGGSNTVEITDWEILRNRTVVIWADHDDAGKKYLDTLIPILQALDCQIRIIDTNSLSLPKGGDIIDYLRSHPNTTSMDIKNLPATQENKTISDEDIIQKLASLPELTYQQNRKMEAGKLNIGVTTLDKLVKEKKQALKDTAAENKTDEIWPEPVNLSMLLDELEKLINSVIVFQSKHEARAIALYVIHTYCIDSANCTPILNITSPEKRCGKSSLLELLTKLVRNPLPASNISNAALYRSIEKWLPTLIIDEADTFLLKNDELRGIINAGHTRSAAFVIRCQGDQHDPQQFSTWCAKIIAGIGHLPETMKDRSIIIQLRRKIQEEKKIRLRTISNDKFKKIIAKCNRFAQDYNQSLVETHSIIPEILNDRAADNWSHLLSIANSAGEKWLKHAQHAANHLSSIEIEPLTISVELLKDIKEIFETKDIDKIYTRDLINALCDDPEKRWLTYNNGKPITAFQLSSLLKEFGINSKDIRIPPNGKNLKGYELIGCAEAFTRYIPSCNSTSESNATTRHEQKHANNTPLSESTSLICRDVADKNTYNENKKKENCDA